MKYDLETSELKKWSWTVSHHFFRRPTIMYNKNSPIRKSMGILILLIRERIQDILLNTDILNPCKRLPIRWDGGMLDLLTIMNIFLELCEETFDHPISLSEDSIRLLEKIEASIGEIR